MNKIFIILKDKKARWAGLAAGFVYILFYLNGIGNIAIVEIPESLSFQVVDDWQDKIFKPIVPFLWEAIVVFFLFGGLIFLLSVPNLLIAFLLGLLIFLNMAVAIYSYSLSRECRVRPGFQGLLGFLPGLFTGFACCVPTFLIPLGPVLASFTVFFIKLRPFLIPASIVLMAGGLIWSIHKIPQVSLISMPKPQKSG